MKVRLTYGKVQIEGEGDTQKDVFKQLAALTEVFRDEPCGLCGKSDCVLTVRRVPDPKSKGKKEFEYFERRCLTPKCGGRLAYGQHNEGGSLFPKRKNDDGSFADKRGWFKWEGKKEEEKSPAY
jgi:hypothetical protein